MSHTVLVIDDSPSVRVLMRSALERAGYAVAEAEDGEQACALLDGRPLGLIVCDLAMPRMDGLSFLRLLRHHPRYRFTPLVVLSTETRAERKAAAKAAGAQVFIPKPCRPSELVDVVQRLCH
jgi:two-component system, chemotaxis family, chemotaxis protein CheY